MTCHYIWHTCTTTNNDTSLYLTHLYNYKQWRVIISDTLVQLQHNDTSLYLPLLPWLYSLLSDCSFLYIYIHIYTAAIYVMTGLINPLSYSSQNICVYLCRTIQHSDFIIFTVGGGYSLDAPLGLSSQLTWYSKGRGFNDHLAPPPLNGRK